MSNNQVKGFTLKNSTAFPIQDDRDDLIDLLIEIKSLQDRAKPILKRIKAHELHLNPECTIFEVRHSDSGNNVTYSMGDAFEKFITGGRDNIKEKFYSDPAFKAFWDANSTEQKGSWTKGSMIELNK